MAGSVGFDVELNAISNGYDRETCWVHARAGMIPPSTGVLTMQKLRLTGSDIFYALHDMRTDDLGATWSEPTKHDTLARRDIGDGMEACPCDFWPTWHEATGVLLGTGHTALYRDDELASGPYPRKAVYSVYDADARAWAEWQTLAMPDEQKFFNCGAGCAQRADLPSGDVLLPVYFIGRKESGDRSQSCYAVTVVRCAFDGATLSYIEHGDQLSVPQPRGFCEPSLARFGGRFYLTLRNDLRGYVTVGDDGLCFDEPRPWTYDDGSELGSVNTQQHWLVHSDALFLVYTRLGPDNQETFRGRAPLFMGEVDVDRLCVIRETERALVPNRWARLGNFGTTMVSRDESWVTVTEWMQCAPGVHWGDCRACEKGGSDNSVFVARVRWDRPNKLVTW